eukprot:UC4_evm4s51
MTSSSSSSSTSRSVWSRMLLHEPESAASGASSDNLPAGIQSSASSYSFEAGDEGYDNILSPSLSSMASSNVHTGSNPVSSASISSSFTTNRKLFSLHRSDKADDKEKNYFNSFSSFSQQQDPQFLPDVAKPLAPTKSLCVKLGGSTSSISASPDATRLVCGGDKILKIIALVELDESAAPKTSFTSIPGIRGRNRSDANADSERNPSSPSHNQRSPPNTEQPASDIDFKSGHRLGEVLEINARKKLMGITDTMWHPIDSDTITTASSNGVVVQWSVSRRAPTAVFDWLRNAVNCVCSHPLESSTHLAATQDGTVRKLDARSVKEAACEFKAPAGVGACRQVRFDPHDSHKFAAVYDNGSIHCWDIRFNKQSDNKIAAHQGPAYSLDFHRDKRNVIATGGRDRFIHVWDLSQHKARCTSTVQTIASVRRVLWRPGYRSHQIASCSQLHDDKVHVWDLQRPYVPIRSWKNNNKDVATGILWGTGAGTVMLSCSKDGTASRYIWSDALEPQKDAKRRSSAIGWSVRGDLCSVDARKSSTRGSVKKSSRSSFVPLFGVGKNSSSINKSNNLSKRQQSIITIYPLSHLEKKGENIELEDDIVRRCTVSFRQLAKSYRFCGGSIHELCAHNAMVAKKHNETEALQAWLMLTEIHKEDTISSRNSSGGQEDPYSSLNRLNISRAPDLKEEKGSRNVLSFSWANPDQLDVQDPSDKKYSMADSNDETKQLSAPGGEPKNLQDALRLVPDLPSNWTLKDEAFNVQEPISSDTDDSVDFEDEGLIISLETRNDPTRLDFFFGNELGGSDIMLDSCPPLKLPPPIIPNWKGYDIVAQLLSFYAERGDVQMSVTVLLILKGVDQILELIPEANQEQWFCSYCDLLDRHRLWNERAQVIRCSHLASVQMLNQSSTTVYTNCGTCAKPLEDNSTGWYCKRCDDLTNTCSICHLPVKGSYVYCQGCGHGGHSNCMQSWFSSHKICPTGCGHLCEFNTWGRKEH